MISSPKNSPGGSGPRFRRGGTDAQAAASTTDRSMRRRCSRCRSPNAGGGRRPSGAGSRLAPRRGTGRPDPRRDRDGDGLIETSAPPTAADRRGLQGQLRRDQRRDRRNSQPLIVLCEVQGDPVCPRRSGAPSCGGVRRHTEEPARLRDAHRRSARLSRCLAAGSSVRDAVALDGVNVRRPSTSNVGHCVWIGIATTSMPHRSLSAWRARRWIRSGRRHWPRRWGRTT